MRGITDVSSAAVYVSAISRTPFGRFSGALSSLTTERIGAIAVDHIAANFTSRIDAAYIGVGMIAGGVLTPARQIILESRLADETTSLTVDRACCSGMTAIGLAAKDLVLGSAETVLCGGVDSLSTTPRLLSRGAPLGPANLSVSDPLLLRAPFGDTSIAAYSGEEAVRMGVDRLEQDYWALQSHERYFAAEYRGLFAIERFPLRTAKVELVTDEGPRVNTTIEKLSALKAVYDSPTITAGNAPGLSDGAAMLLLSRRAPKEPPPIKILGHAQIACDRTSGTRTPAIAIQRLLHAFDFRLEDLAALEINEAFAATPLVSTLHLCDHNRKSAERLRERTNVHGGAVAIGHPLGASGARITMALINVLRVRGGGLGVAAICGGYGQGDAILLRVG